MMKAPIKVLMCITFLRVLNAVIIKSSSLNLTLGQMGVLKAMLVQAMTNAYCVKALNAAIVIIHQNNS